MKYRFKVLVLLSFLSSSIWGQETMHFDRVPLLFEIDTLKSVREVKFFLDSISGKQFSAYKKQFLNTQPSKSKKIQSEDSAFVPAKVDSLYFPKNADYKLPYTYGGYIPALRCHKIDYCHEICESFLLDHTNNKKMMIPSSYDQGVLGMSFSPSNKKWMVYSSYDGPDFDNYYYYRAEIFFYTIDLYQGIDGIHYYGAYLTKDWSISEVYWIDENAIALKMYQENRWGDGSNVHYSYFTAKVNQ